MIERASALFDKEVICMNDGTRLGMIGEFELNTETGKIETLIIPGRPRLFGLLGRDDDIILPFACIKVMGDEVILADIEPPKRTGRSLFSVKHR